MATRTFLAHVLISVTKTELSVDGQGALNGIPAGSNERTEWYKNQAKDAMTAANALRAVTGVSVNSIDEVNAVMTR
jgi:hypothetical protein